MDGETETRASLGVTLGKLDGVLGNKGTRSSDGDLVASNVVLSTTSGTGSVERDGLGTEEIITRSNVRRDLEVELSAVVVQVLCAPEVGVTLGCSWVLLPAVLVDLEELARAISSGSVLDLAHVSEDRSPVSATNALRLAVAGVGLLVHLDRDRVTGLEIAFS